MALAACVVVAGCGDSGKVGMDDTEVMVRNDLEGIQIPNVPTVDSVHVYGLRIGSDLSWSVVRAGAETGYSITDDYGSSVALTIDSLAVFVEIGTPPWNNTKRTVVSDVGTYHVTIRRYEQNVIVLDDNLIPLSELFGTTKVRAVNRLYHVNVSIGSTAETIDSLELFGVSIGGALFDHVLPGDTTAYDTCEASGGFALVSIDSVIGYDTYLTQSQRLTWTLVDTFSVSVRELVSNDVVFGSSSTRLLSGLDSLSIESLP